MLRTPPTLAALIGLLTACNGAPEVALDVLSPVADDIFVQGAPVLLDVAITADGLPSDADPTWSADGWTMSGNRIEVTDLPLGSYDLAVSVEVDGGLGSALVPIEVIEPPLEPVDYDGVLSLQTDITSPFWSGTADCTHLSLSFTVEPLGELTGEGSCEAPVVGVMAFVLDGQVAGSAVSGSMTTVDNPNELAFEGTVAADGAIVADFDETFSEGEGTMRLYGTWDAMPVTP